MIKKGFRKYEKTQAGARLQKGWDGGFIGWEGDGKAWKRMIRMEKKESMGRGRKCREKNEKPGKRTERLRRGRKG